MNLDGWAFGWREGLIAAIFLLGIYVLVAVLRMRQLKRGAAPMAADAQDSPDSSDPPELSDAPAVSAPAAAKEPTLARKPAPDFAWNEPPEPDFALMDRDLRQLRGEVSTLRGELGELRELLRLQMAQLKATQNISPIYSDAMQLAMLGHDAGAIAERCSIARAEAELVVALVRNRDE